MFTPLFSFPLLPLFSTILSSHFLSSFVTSCISIFLCVFSPLSYNKPLSCLFFSHSIPYPLFSFYSSLKLSHFFSLHPLIHFLCSTSPLNCSFLTFHLSPTTLLTLSGFKTDQSLLYRYTVHSSYRPTHNK